MMNLTHIKNLLFLLLLFVMQLVLAQQRLVMNGAYINISRGTKLVIDNPSPNALTRISGHIITEGENNEVKWNIGTSTGTYTVPLGYSTNYLPLEFTKTAGTGAGCFNFSMYHTGWNNTAMLPTGVLNVNYNGVDNSPYTIDRFWKIDAAGYTAKPTLTDLTFTYLDTEHTATGNAITEDELGAQRWNSTINDWGDFIPGVTIDVSANRLTVTTVSGPNLYRWWTMPAMNGYHALPVELADFKGVCNGAEIKLSWNTLSELNNKKFLVERSDDAINWSTVQTVEGAGNSNRKVSYSINVPVSEQESYFRLKQTDYNGKTTNSPIVNVNCSAEPASIAEVFPNPSTGLFFIKNATEGSSLEVMNIYGEVVLKQQWQNGQPLEMHGLSNGVYMLLIQTASGSSSHKLLLQQ